MRLPSRVFFSLIILGINVTGCVVKPFSGMHSEEIRTEFSLEIIEHAVEAMVTYVPREEIFYSAVMVWEKTPKENWYSTDKIYSAIECHLVKVIVTVDLSSMAIDSIGSDSLRVILQLPELAVGTERTVHIEEFDNSYEADKLCNLRANVDAEVENYFANQENSVNVEAISKSKEMTEMLMQQLIGALHEGIYILFVWE